MPAFPSAATCAASLFSLLIFAGFSQGQVSIVEKDSSAEDRIEAALAQHVSFTFREEPFQDAIDAIQHKTGLPIVLAAKKLDEAAITLDTRVTLSMRDVTLESFFRNLLRERDMTILIRNEALVISTQEDAASNLVTRTYPVLDLVGSVATSSTGSREAVADYDSLIEVITTTLEPDSWDEVGGPGSVAEFPNAGVLVISQTRDNHQKIATLLNSLRRAKALQGLPTIAPLAKASSAVRSVERGVFGNRESVSVSSRRRVESPQGSWQLPQVYEE